MALEEAAKIPDILEAAGVADLLEHTLYNAALPGLSLDGQNYFYRNPLSDSGIHRRSPWFGVARCPPNAARLLASLPGYFYGVSDDGVWVHLYAEGTAEVRLDDDRTVGLRQRTHYPWDGNVEIEVDGENDFSLMLRIPAWCEEGAAIEINGDPFDGSVSPGSYAEIRRAWRPGDKVRLALPMPVSRVECHPYVSGNAGRVALMRGPLPKDRWGIIGSMVETESSAKDSLAVFDVDGTLFRRGLLPALTRRLVNEGIFSERVREELSRDYYAWVERRGSYDTYDRLVVDLFLRELKGVTVTDLQRCARAEVEAHGRRLHIYTRDVALRLKQAGCQLVAISGSPQEILDLFLKPLGFDRSWGTVLAKDAQGYYTGEVLHHPFKNKRQVLEEFLEEANIDLQGSVGMGDTLSDVGFLEMVWTPIAFNPNRDLLEVARQRGWPIVVERKDVIYNLQTPLKDPVLKDGTLWMG